MAESTHKKRILSQTKTKAFAFRVTGPKAQRLFVCVFPGRKQPDRHLSAKENLRLWTKAGGGSLSYIDILRHIAEEAGGGEDIVHNGLPEPFDRGPLGLARQDLLRSLYELGDQVRPYGEGPVGRIYRIELP